MSYRNAGAGQMFLRLGDGELAEMEDRGGEHRRGAALDHALDQVVEGADAARGHHRHRHGVRHRAGEILLTSMDRDGTKSGFDLELTRAVSDAVPVPVVASGGVGKLDDLVDGVTKGGASAVLAASIFHFGEFTIAQAKDHLARAGVPIRQISQKG